MKVDLVKNAPVVIQRKEDLDALKKGSIIAYNKGAYELYIKVNPRVWISLKGEIVSEQTLVETQGLPSKVVTIERIEIKEVLQDSSLEEVPYFSPEEQELI